MPCASERSIESASVLVALALLTGCERTPAPTASATATATASASAPALASSPSAASAPSTSPEAPLDLSGAIAFVSERDGRKAVYVVEPRTGRSRRLVDRAMDDYVGPPSPKGNRLLLVSAEDREGGLHREQMWTLGADGELTKLGQASGMIRNPSWLPDGGGVVFESSRLGFRDLFLVELGGTERQLTDVAQGCFEPDVHPDGERLVYVSSEEGNADVYTRDLDGGAPQRLTWSPRDDTAPRWAPNGEHIAWISLRNGRNVAYVMNADGSKPRPIAEPTDDLRGQQDVVWSPNGDAVAFTQRHQGGHASVVVAALNDGRVLFDSAAEGTREGVVDEMPAFSPDGRALAFVSNREGDTELYVASLGKGAGSPVRLTRSEGPDWLPRWLPDTFVLPGADGSGRKSHSRAPTMIAPPSSASEAGQAPKTTPSASTADTGPT